MRHTEVEWCIGILGSAGLAPHGDMSRTAVLCRATRGAAGGMWSGACWHGCVGGALRAETHMCAVQQHGMHLQQASKAG